MNTFILALHLKASQQSQHSSPCVFNKNIRALTIRTVLVSQHLHTAKGAACSTYHSRKFCPHFASNCTFSHTCVSMQRARLAPHSLVSSRPATGPRGNEFDGASNKLYKPLNLGKKSVQEHTSRTRPLTSPHNSKTKESNIPAFLAKQRALISKKCGARPTGRAPHEHYDDLHRSQLMFSC